MENQAHPVDVHVGARIRARRRALNQSQEALSDELGLTFQQVQKYERGANRVSASKLFQISVSQRVPISYYFDGLEGVDVPDVQAAPEVEAAKAWLGSAIAWDIAFPMSKLSGKLARSVVNMVHAMVKDSDAQS